MGFGERHIVALEAKYCALEHVPEALAMRIAKALDFTCLMTKQTSCAYYLKQDIPTEH